MITINFLRKIFLLAIILLLGLFFVFMTNLRRFPTAHGERLFKEKMAIGLFLIS